MESYRKRKREKEEKYGKLINVPPGGARPTPDISDEDGLTKAYAATNGLHQHYNKLFIAGTRDFPRDYWDDLNILFGKTLDGKRGHDAEAHYQEHKNQIDTVVGHSLGGAIALNLEQKYGQQSGGIIQSKTFGSATASFPGGNKADRIRYLGDPISALDFNATTVVPSIGRRWNQSAHSFQGLSIPDKIPVHEGVEY